MVEEQYRKHDFGTWIDIRSPSRDRDKEGGVQLDQSACDREPTQLEQYAWCGSGESGGQLGMKADGQK